MSPLRAPRGRVLVSSAILVTVTGAAACTAILGETDVPTPRDAGSDAALDGARDATLHDGGGDAARDARHDVTRADARADGHAPTDAPGDVARGDAREAGSDAGRDAARDGHGDAGPDGPRGSDAAGDAKPDAGRDAAVDADAAVDSGVDSGVDAGSVYARAVMDDGPLAYWRLGEPPGSTVAKDETHRYDGTYVGDVGFGVPGALARDTDTAISLDGTGSSPGYVSVGGTFAQLAEFTGNAPFTLEAWVKPSGLRALDAVLSNVASGATREGYVLYLGGSTEAGASIDFSRFDNGTEHFAREDASVVGVGPSWYHVVATYDGSTSTVYVNGEVKATTSDSQTIPSFSCTFNIGASHCGTTSYFQGDVDEVAVYDTALTLPQVQHHYNVGR